MTWVKCSDRPPEGNKFLAYNKDGDIAVVWKVDSYYIRGGWYGCCEYGCGGDDHFEEITHWMPLPEPPKE